MSDIHLRIQNELVSSGKYKEIYTLLETELCNSGWTEKFQTLTQKTVESSKDEDLNLKTMLNQLQDKGKESIPDEVKAKAVKKIADFLNNVVE